MRHTRLLLPLLLAAALPLAAQSRVPDEPVLQRPFLDWDRGAYDDAIEGYLEVLNGPRGAELKDQIAELTGELNPVVELAPNGARLAVSPDGRWMTLVVVENGAQVTKVLSLPGGALNATLPSGITALLDSGRVAYVARRVTPEVEAARREVAGAATPEARAAAQARQGAVESRASEIRVRSLANGRETPVATNGWGPVTLTPAGGALLSIAVPPTEGPVDAIVLEGGTVRALGSGGLTAMRAVPGGRWVIAAGGGPQRNEILLLDRQGGAVRRFPGRRSPAISADGSTVAMLTTQGGQTSLEVLRPGAPGDPQVLFRTPLPIESPAVSPRGTTVAYQKQPLHDWEIYARSVSAGESSAEVQLTFEIQHDALPQFLDEDHVLAVKGEPRHRRSYVYSLTGGAPLKLFHNNTVRTIAPEYEWLPVAGGSRVLIVADRDGDAISPERGVYLLDRTATVTLSDVRQRLQASLGTEKDLRARGSRAFLPIGNPVREILGAVSTARIESYAEDLFEFGSRSIFRPGNAKTVDYLAARLREFGYEPEIQTFVAPGGTRIANVIARLAGTTNPELVYVTSAHLDTVEEGPGSDDDGSGITSLLEAARVLRNRPLAATVEFVFFTGEEEGLYGSLEYARRAVAERKQVVGVVNNDMIGFTNDHRLDMTIRWSNPGIRDIMHGAAIFFTDLITYDAHYYRNTDAGSLNDAFGDIVGGMGAYPILGTPYYHQPTDRIETVNQRLVTEACKTTIATLILLASAPRPVQALELRPAQNGGLDLTWAPAPEVGVIGYIVRWTDAMGAPHEERVGPTPAPAANGTSPARIRFALETARVGSFVSVKAVADDGREGWDWATIVAPR